MGHARHHHVAAGFIKRVNNLARKKKTELNNNLAIAYYRFSSHSQNKVSIEQQRELSHSWAGAHGFNIMMEHNGTACLEDREAENVRVALCEDRHSIQSYFDKFLHANMNDPKHTTCCVTIHCELYAAQLRTANCDFYFFNKHSFAIAPHIQRFNTINNSCNQLQQTTKTFAVQPMTPRSNKTRSKQRLCTLLDLCSLNGLKRY